VISWHRSLMGSSIAISTSSAERLYSWIYCQCNALSL